MEIEGEILGARTWASHEVTYLLGQWRAGNEAAFHELLPLVYQELHTMAHRYLRREKKWPLLQTTELLNEAWLNLAAKAGSSYENRAHFLAVAANVMRHLLVDYARRQRAEKRGGGVAVETLDENLIGDGGPRLDVLALHEALSRLEAIAARKARIVELRYFGELSHAEIAVVLGVAEITVKKDWQKAKVLLAALLNEGHTNNVSVPK